MARAVSRDNEIPTENWDEEEPEAAAGVVTVTEQSDTKVYTDFAQLPIDRGILRGVYSAGFERPSEIQQKGIKPFLDGKNMVAQAQSGTGKTAMFCISSLQRCDAALDAPQVIILSPTRDLAIQTDRVIQQLNEFSMRRTILCIGGEHVAPSIRALRTPGKVPQIVIGTPGRILHLIDEKALLTSHLKVLVIDEADEMLKVGFREQMVTVFQRMPPSIQICLVSATMPPEVVDIANRLLREPCAKILVKKEDVTLAGIKQYCVAVENDRQKIDTILDLYTNLPISFSIIFCNTKRRVETLAKNMADRGHCLSVIHGDMTLDERRAQMQRCIKGEARVLIASDLYARGIDLQQLSMVINYDLPTDRENYIHRIGRAGRYARKGLAINLITPREAQQQTDIIAYYDTQIEELPENYVEIASML